MVLRTLPDGFFGKFLVLQRTINLSVLQRARGAGDHAPYTGKCFLYVDNDSNSLCGYTPTAITSPRQIQKQAFW